MKRNPLLPLFAGAYLLAAPVAAQEGWSTQDPVLLRIWELGMDGSQVEPLAQALLDSIGPRLTGSPGQISAHEWAVRRYGELGIQARNEQYGTWRGWRRGVTHVDLLEPRVRTLEGQMLAWSPGSSGPVTAPVVLLPDLPDAAAFQAWLPQAHGKIVLVSPAQPTCRPDENWEKWALPASFERMKAERTEAMRAWDERVARTGSDARDLPRVLEGAGAVGILTSRWSQGWGVNKVFSAPTEAVPALDLSCEDYGLVFRLAENGQGPVVRINAEAEFLGEAPTLNTVAEIRGREKPEEYVLLSAHFDSWDAASGATDNGTGTVVMMEAMRILREAYPRPKRTIMAGHWGGEEQGLNGSRAFAEDHPEVVEGLHVLFNQDNGTGRIANVSMQGFTDAAPFFRRWFAAVPAEMTRDIRVDDPGTPGGGGSDHAAFVCHGAPAFMLGSLSWDYGSYTWHTNRDTYDKISFDDVRRNATLVAMLAYLAAEEPGMLPRTRRTEFPVNPNTGQAGAWPTCRAPARTAGE